MGRPANKDSRNLGVHHGVPLFRGTAISILQNSRNKVHTYPLNPEFPAEVMAPVDCLRTTSAQGSKHGGILEEKKHHAFDRFRSTAATTVVEARIYCQ